MVLGRQNGRDEMNYLWCCRICAALVLLLIPGCVSIEKNITVGVDDAFVKKYTFNRSEFGTSPLLFWYGLSEFECLALSNKENAINGDPQALLALAIFASGNMRTMSTWEMYRIRVEEFVERIKPDVDKVSGDEQKGRIIFEQMCNTFLDQWSGSNDLRGYNFGQSQLTELFRNGEFNCVSSSLLYMVCARYFGLTVKGVEIPSHIFVQLETRQGRKIEIETTIKTGYGIVHDEKFYKNQSDEWYESRKLTRSTYQDYCNRKIYEPYKIIAKNMFNQHAGESRMATVDRNRLLEASGYLDSADMECTRNRLTVYNNEYCYFQKIADTLNMLRMFSKIGPLLNELKLSWARNTSLSDLVGLFVQQYYYALIYNSRESDALDLVSEAVEFLQIRDNAYIKMINNINLMTNSYIDRQVKENHFDQSIQFLDRYESYPQLKGDLVNKRVFIYEFWGHSYWQQQNWEQTILQFSKALSNTSDSAVTKRICGNIIGAYTNWSATFSKNDDWATAVEKLTLALNYAKTGESVLKCNNAIAGIYCNWGSAFFKKNQWSAAIEKYTMALQFTKEEELSKTVCSNIQSASINWLISLTAKKDRDLCRKLMQQCVEKCPQCIKCQLELTKLQTL